MRIAIAAILAAGCATTEEAACEALADAYVEYSSRCGTTPRLFDRGRAADFLFGAPDACARIGERAFRDIDALCSECIPAIETRLACSDEPILPPSCEGQILVSFGGDE